MSDETFNGWANYETWNVALYLTNDESDYRRLVDFARDYSGTRPYVDFILACDLAGEKTADGVLWLDPRLDEDELNSVVVEYADH